MADKIGTDEYGEILIYQTDDGQTNIEVKIEDDTVWLTQQQMSELFQTSRTNVVEHSFMMKLAYPNAQSSISVLYKSRFTVGPVASVPSAFVHKLPPTLKILLLYFTEM